MSKIMIVDDDPYIRELICALVKNGGYEPCEAKDGRDALTKLSEENPDLCVVDLMMPNMDGYELCRKIRQYYANIAVLMLTAKAELPSKAKGFEVGTDDYMTKPFEGDELLMRIRALLRRYKIESSQLIQIGNVTVDRNSYSVIVSGQKQDIPMKEFELLFKLAGFPNKTFSRDSLIEHLGL